jgi:hypothetical protein
LLDKLKREKERIWYIQKPLKMDGPGPLGVSEYTLSKALDEKLKQVLPVL